MEKITEYLDELSMNDLLGAYGEYKNAKKNGIYPSGVIRTIAKMFKEISGTLDLQFAEKILLERFADIFYRQNKA